MHPRRHLGIVKRATVLATAGQRRANGGHVLPEDTRLFSGRRPRDRTAHPVDRPAPHQGPRDVPGVVRQPDRTDAWRYEDTTALIERGGSAHCPRSPTSTPRTRPTTKCGRGATTRAPRPVDMDLDGVATQLAFPHFPRFAGHRFLMKLFRRRRQHLKKKNV